MELLKWNELEPPLDMIPSPWKPHPVCSCGGWSRIRKRESSSMLFLSSVGEGCCRRRWRQQGRGERAGDQLVEATRVRRVSSFSPYAAPSFIHWTSRLLSRQPWNVHKRTMAKRLRGQTTFWNYGIQKGALGVLSMSHKGTEFSKFNEYVSQNYIFLQARQTSLCLHSLELSNFPGNVSYISFLKALLTESTNIARSKFEYLCPIEKKQF